MFPYLMSNWKNTLQRVMGLDNYHVDLERTIGRTGGSSTACDTMFMTAIFATLCFFLGAYNFTKILLFAI
jgi:hypothetical protein